MKKRKAKKKTRLQIVEESVEQIKIAIAGLKEHNKSLWDALFSGTIQNDRFNRMVDSQTAILSMLNRQKERIEKLERKQ
jgi:hypothetical protein